MCCGYPWQVNAESGNGFVESINKALRDQKLTQVHATIFRAVVAAT